MPSESQFKPGESRRFDCTDCSCEFEIVYEPKCRDNPKSAKGMEPAELEADFKCPFCGGALETDDTDESDE